MFKNILMMAVLFTVLATGAFAAGGLFPPENTPNGGCSNGEVLTWTGNSLICKDPTPGVRNIKCGDKEYMYQINNGVPQCGDLSAVVKKIVRSCRGKAVYYGTVQGTNAGVLTLNPAHLNGATSKVGYLFSGC